MGTPQASGEIVEFEGKFWGAGQEDQEQVKAR